MEFEFGITQDEVMESKDFDDLVCIASRKLDHEIFKAMVRAMDEQMPKDVKLPSYADIGKCDL